jgi:glycosyltransferase involved in cell wall biosynthesis
VKTERQEIRDAWNISRDAFVILFCGKFIPKKRPMDLLAAASSLATRHPSLKIHLLFAGSGELGADLRSHCDVVYDAEAQRTEDRGQRSAQNKLTSDLRPPTSGTKPLASFAGFLNQTEVSRAYVAADVLVLPSDYNETWGLVVNEAMASGLPCIVSDRCGCAEDLGKLPSNAIYECGNVEQLANRLLEFNKKTVERPSVGELEHFSFDETVRTITRLWQN